MLRRRWVTAALVSAVVAAAACRTDADDTANGASCPRVVWFKPASASSYVEVIGDFNGWKRPGVPLDTSAEDGTRGAQIYLTPGEHTYTIVADGTWVLDKSVGTTAYSNGKEVTWIDVADCHAPSIKVDKAAGGEIRATFTPAENGSAIDSSSVSIEGLAATADGNTIHATVPASAKGQSRFTIHAKDQAGHDATAAIATYSSEPTTFELRDALVYQVMLDRYRDEAGALRPPASPAGRAGGTFDGLRRSIERGEIEELGANVLWLSPVYKNPDGEFPGAPGRSYTGYHGYWPVAARDVDPHLGTADDLKKLVETAHQHDIRVLFDVVPNHVHQDHPYAKRAGFTDGVSGQCTCGAPNCPWDAHMLDCWFAPYLPDLDWTNPELARAESQDITYWVDTFGADGVRIDAVPMVPRSASRRIAYDLRARFEHPGNNLWIIGENFTGPGAFNLLKPELGPFGLDTEFHFPLMWTLRNVIAADSGKMSDIDDDIAKTAETFAGAGATMGLMIGNHDVARFATASAGDSNGDGWTLAPFADDAEVYAKQLVALALVETLPGAAFVYYGDEIALPGRGDPDTRRVMPGLDTVRPEALKVRESIARLGRARRCSDVLRRGVYHRVYADEDTLVYARATDNKTAFVVASRHKDSQFFRIPLPGIPAGKYVDVLTGTTLTVDPALTPLPGASWSVGVYLTASDTCVSQ